MAAKEGAGVVTCFGVGGGHVVNVDADIVCRAKIRKKNIQRNREDKLPKIKASKKKKRKNA
jgi:ribosomal protein L21